MHHVHPAFTLLRSLILYLNDVFKKKPGQPEINNAYAVFSVEKQLIW